MPPSDSLHPRALAALQSRLLAWFDTHRRPLPWRNDRDAYRIWLSEVMLQQTTVAAVVPYFERFVAAFPTVGALAESDEARVLKLWEGLGYYRRALHLHAAAKRLVADHGGNLPNDPGVWSELPGVGRYILGAVLSQAFDRRLPIVEANSLRVLARLFGHRRDPRAGAGKAWVWSAAARVLPARRAGDFNQALMELGALVCTPTVPRCKSCPLARHCVANRQGIQALIPPPKKKPAVIAVPEVGVVIRKGQRVLLCRLPAGAARWPNMWEFPHAERRAGEEAGAAARRIARELTGLAIVPGVELGTVKHGVTRYRITLTCLNARWKSGDFRAGYYAQAKWLRARELSRFPLSTPQRKLAAEVMRNDHAK